MEKDFSYTGTANGSTVLMCGSMCTSMPKMEQCRAVMMCI